jgi:hypothetical protein
MIRVPWVTVRLIREVRMWAICIKQARATKAGNTMLVRTTIDFYMTLVLALGRHCGEDCRISAPTAMFLAARRAGGCKTLEFSGPLRVWLCKGVRWHVLYFSPKYAYFGVYNAKSRYCDTMRFAGKLYSMFMVEHPRTSHLPLCSVCDACAIRT